MNDTRQKIEANRNRIKTLLHYATCKVRMPCYDYTQSVLDNMVALRKELSDFVGVDDYDPSSLDGLI
jgi:hypothetical protein